jgi:hypothetical protein
MKPESSCNFLGRNKTLVVGELNIQYKYFETSAGKVDMFDCVLTGQCRNGESLFNFEYKTKDRCYLISKMAIYVDTEYTAILNKLVEYHERIKLLPSTAVLYWFGSDELKHILASDFELGRNDVL